MIGRGWLVAAVAVLAGTTMSVPAGLVGGPLARVAGVAGAQEDEEPGDVVSVEAAPQLLDEVADALLDRSWYVEAGSGVAEGPVVDVAEAMRDAGEPWGLVALATPPPRGTRNFTANLLAEVRSRGAELDTVLVVTDEDVSGFSRGWSDHEVAAALEAALPAFEAGTAGGFAAVHAQLTGEALEVDTSGDDGGVGVPLWLVGVGGVAAGLAAAGVALAAGRRQRA